MKALLKTVFGFAVFFVLVAVIGRIFFFEIAHTVSYSMIPNLSAGDTFLVYKHATLSPGDVALCRNPENPSTMIVLRILGIPGSTFAIRKNLIYLDGNIYDFREHSGTLVYVDNTSGEQLEYLVELYWQRVNGRNFRVSFMDRAGNRNFATHEVQEGFFLVGDNRNRARDSRNFGEVPIEDCLGKAFLVIWPGPDSGDLTWKDRFLSWL